MTIGDDVEIGANTTIDRGALSDTLIGNGVKLDNQIMIAHNVQIGDHTAMAACVGISGSAKIGRHCMLAGGVGLVGHIEICDNVFVTGMTMVTRSITEPGSYSSGTAMQPAAEWKKRRAHSSTGRHGASTSAAGKTPGCRDPQAVTLHLMRN